MTGTLTPPPSPPQSVPEPAVSHPDVEAPRQWWHRGWVLIAAVVVLGLVGWAIYNATTGTSEHDELVDDMTELGMSETEAEQYVSDLEQLDGELDDELDDELALSDPSDGSLSPGELEVVREVYMVFRDTELGELSALPHESEFTDEQIRSYTEEACTAARASDSLAELQVRAANAFADEPHPMAAGTLGGTGTAGACRDAMMSLEGMP